MSFYADLHIHSKYSRATSKDCDLEHLTFWGRKKGIHVIGTGDFTHPAWFKEIKEKLEPAEPGLFKLKDAYESEILKNLPPSCTGVTRFMLSVEISTIYKKGEKTRKIHHLIYAPTIAQADFIRMKLDKIGNINSDGRPILGLDSRDLLEIVLEAGEGCYLVPAHIWTPWFAALGSKSGFDCIDDCYGDLAPHIFALETGLSSDPEMNARVSSLDRFRLMSNSDAHSPAKLGRESNIFHTSMNYFEMKKALETGEGFGGTLEFFPEEGKYHLDGHRKCGVRLTPKESKLHQGVCPICKKPLTLGVLYRVDELADREEKEAENSVSDFKSIIPLPEVISEIVQVGPASKKVALEYHTLLHKLGSEFSILNDLTLDQIKKESSSLISEAISRMREGKVIRDAGFDGEYGQIKLFKQDELKTLGKGAVLFDMELPQVNQQEFMKVPTQKKAKTTPKRSTSSPDKVSFAFDQEQNKAIETIEGPVLITAGPGSGKTRTLTERVSNLIEKNVASPESCLTITFTQRAAQEMRDRLCSRLPKEGQKIPVMTFHQLAFQMLKEHRLAVGLPRGFRIMGEEERFHLIQSRFHGSDKKTRRDIEAVRKLKLESNKSSDKELQAIEELLAELKEKDGLLDFDDLLLLANQLLEEHIEIAALYRQSYSWISIDEFQDIDQLQYELIKKITTPTSNILAIGDPDQSIYRFRGANVQYFLNFEHDFPKTSKIKLSHNYRSGIDILKASNQMIQPSAFVSERPDVTFTSESGRVTLHQAVSDKAEAEYITHSIEKMIGGVSFFSMDTNRSDGTVDKEYSFSDFAILYRTEAQAPLLIEALSRLGIPHQFQSDSHLDKKKFIDRILSEMERANSKSLLQNFRAATSALVSLGEIDTNEQSQEIDYLETLAVSCEDNFELFGTKVLLSEDTDIWSKKADKVSLMSLHASKGLEFPVVFIAGCEEGFLPHSFGKKLDQEEIKEERRLFFVGMTRAKDHLVICHSQKRLWRGRIEERSRSRFLDDIEETLLKLSKSDGRPKNRSRDELQLSLFSS